MKILIKNLPIQIKLASKWDLGLKDALGLNEIK